MKRLSKSLKLAKEFEQIPSENLPDDVIVPKKAEEHNEEEKEDEIEDEDEEITEEERRLRVRR